MMDQNFNFHARAMEKVRRMWHLYLLDEKPDLLESEFRAMPDNLLTIGTGRHEFYKTRDAYLSVLREDQQQAHDIQFELQDEWYEALAISDTICVVYGSIWVREKAAPGKMILVDMEGSRFSLVCRDTDHGVEICHIHHSMPYIDQGTDEYYPKSLSHLANEAAQKTALLEKRIELDHMTELYSRYYMERHVSGKIKKNSGYFFMLDLDEFKKVNDTMGHLAGDQVIIEFARLLRLVFSENAILGRMGGDEFSVWEEEIQSREEAEERFFNLLEGCGHISAELGISVSCSGGLALCMQNGEDFTSLFNRADQALYHAKITREVSFSWAEPYSITHSATS